MPYRHLSIRRVGAIIECTISNPPTHTLTEGGVAELHAFMDEVEASEGLRALILTGADDGVFIAHYEVAELAEASAASGGAAQPSDASPQELHELNRLCLRLEALPLPTIAAVNGSAGGGGWELALACDFRLLCDGPYHFGLPETNVGILPGAGGTQRYARLLGTARALDLILHGQLLSAAEALEFGLASRVYPADGFREATEAFAETLAKRSPIGLAQAKRAIRAGAELPLEAALLHEQACFDRAMQSQDAAGAMKAWLSGKRWQWTGR